MTDKRLDGLRVAALATDGVEVRPIRNMAGYSLFNEVFLSDVFVPDDHVVGEVGDGDADLDQAGNDQRQEGVGIQR